MVDVLFSCSGRFSGKFSSQQVFLKGSIALFIGAALCSLACDFHYFVVLLVG